MFAEDDTARPAGFPYWLMLLAAFVPPLFSWGLLYRVAGYNLTTYLAALLLSPLVALALIRATRIEWRYLGLGTRQLWQACAVAALAYGVLLGVGLVLSTLGAIQTPPLRSSYDWFAFFDNWVLTALGEELLFAGVLFAATVARLPRRRLWLAVLLVAAVFALWHLPGYLARDMAAGTIVGRLALNAVSWCLFGTIYALSGNLWLVALAHAATDYPVSPLVTGEPVLGLLFFAVLIAGAWWLGRGKVRPFVRRTACNQPLH